MTFQPGEPGYCTDMRHEGYDRLIAEQWLALFHRHQCGISAELSFVRANIDIGQHICFASVEGT